MVKVKYLKLKKAVWHFQRRNPASLRRALGLPEFHVETLSTRDKAEAAFRAKKLNTTVEANWRKLEATLANTSGTPKEVEEAAEALLRSRGLSPGDANEKEWAEEVLESLRQLLRGGSLRRLCRRLPPRHHRRGRW
ncbi:MAG: DUF6538 domain-containing protein [Methylocystis sp.]